MKSMTKLIVVAMILAAALVVAPAAARGVSASGDNVFVGEEKLTFSGTDFTGITSLVHYTGEKGKSSTDKIISVSGGTIDELVKGIPTGSYYARNATNANNESAYVNVQNPEATLDIMLGSSPKDSVNGKSVTRGTELIFKFYSNVDTGAKVNIELTLPGGGVTTNYTGQPLTYNANGQTRDTVKVILPGDAEAGTYTAVAKWDKATTDFYGKGYDSKAVTFEVLTKALAITATKDSVVRGNSFTVTITGESNKEYYLYVKDAGNVKYPGMINQLGVNFTTNVNPGANVPSNAQANVTTNAGGTRSVQFNTDTSTEARSFTIRVEDPSAPLSTNDEVKVKVEEGSVTITTSGTGTYYIGEEITLSGTCTDNKTAVHLFMTGPNLDDRGVNLETLVYGNIPKNVEADDTWSYKWNTAQLLKGRSLDAGGYTIYAVSKPVDKNGLSRAKYATASVNLRSGFITATTSGATVARGDELKITGTAQGNPNNVQVWIFGKNFYGQFGTNNLTAASASVESDGSFEHKLKSSETTQLAAGQYFVVVQHPMGDDFGVKFDSVNGTISGDGINTVTLTNL